MTTTSAPQRPDPTRTGAVWVTGTGVFLLLAAAAVFTAVRWADIHPAVKLAALVLATGSCLLAGRTLRPAVPATASALFHLGTFLVPIVVAALGVRSHLGWPDMLLAQGAAAAATFGWAAAVERSVVLRWAWGASVVVLAAGVAAVTGLPAVPLLALAAVAAVAAGLERAALGWAAVAALAPVGVHVARDADTGAGTLADLGVGAGQHPIATSVAALLAGAVIVVVARRRADADLVVLGAAAGAAGAGAGWLGGDPGRGDLGLGIAAAFLLVQVAALRLRADAFWARPLAVVARSAEWAGAVVLGLLALARLGSPDLDPGVALTGLLLAAGWVAADQRRPSGLAGGSALVGSSLLLGAAFATESPWSLGATWIAVAAGSLRAGRRDAIPVAVAAALFAPFGADDSTAALALTSAVAAWIITEAAVRVSLRFDPDLGPTRPDAEPAWMLTLAALVPIALGSALLERQHGVALLPLLLGTSVAALAAAAWADRGPSASDLPLGTLLRAGALAPLALAAELPATEVALLGALLAVAFVVEAVRLDHPSTALGASLAVPVALGAFIGSTGLSTPDTGVGLTVAAVVLAGAGSLLGGRWAVPVLAAVVLAAGGGLVLAGGDPTALANALLVTGGLGLAAGTALVRPEVMVLGGLALTAGWWLRLTEAEVGVAEPYLVPVAVVLLLAGARSRAAGTSSWIAYGPVVALGGGAALMERVQGGAGWHALVAGGVGVVAVVAGAQRRLAAPLVLGTTLLVAVVGYETLAITAAIDTWVWLAAGGAALLGAGVAMERREIGPLETGRRLVDVVAERYG